jgi:hypothetical protein
MYKVFKTREWAVCANARADHPPFLSSNTKKQTTPPPNKQPKQTLTNQEFNMCVADMYWCDYYCKYAPSWYYGLVAKGDKACPIDPSMIDPLTPDPICARLLLLFCFFLCVVSGFGFKKDTTRSQEHLIGPFLNSTSLSLSLPSRADPGFAQTAAGRRRLLMLAGGRKAGRM